MLTKAIVFAVGCSALTFGCAADQASDDTQEITDNLVQAGFPADDIRLVDGLVYVGNDAVVSLQASREMISSPEAGQEQFRTNNLVSSAITNICVNGATFTGVFSDALNRAITNYNNEGLSFRMTRTTGGTAGCSTTITARLSGGTGGSSGFPSGGRPFNTINIGPSLSTFDVNTIEHVITHELGHTIGFRHSDFFNRSISCGGAATNEGDGGVGAILIPGTPSGAVVGQSIMNSCFRTIETGEFTPSDRTALNALY
jgi:Dual-action HEIGH metallo-peptidase